LNPEWNHGKKVTLPFMGSQEIDGLLGLELAEEEGRLRRAFFTIKRALDLSNPPTFSWLQLGQILGLNRYTRESSLNQRRSDWNVGTIVKSTRRGKDEKLWGE